MAYNPETVRQLEEIENNIYDRHRITSAPADPDKRREIIMDMAGEIHKLNLCITQEDADQLTADNYHMMHSAVIFTAQLLGPFQQAGLMTEGDPPEGCLINRTPAADPSRA